MRIKSLRALALLSFSVCIVFVGCKSKEEKQAEAVTKTIIKVSKQLAEEEVAAKTNNAIADAAMKVTAYESSLLAAVAEMGDNVTKKDLLYEGDDSGDFTVSISDDGTVCTATATKDIGEFKEGGTITSKYDKAKERFIHSSSQPDVVKKILPKFL
jgi:hypothetical protein